MMTFDVKNSIKNNFFKQIKKITFTTIPLNKPFVLKIKHRQIQILSSNILNKKYIYICSRF